MAGIGTLTAYLVADTARFTSGLNRARSDLNSSGAAINRGLAGIEVSFRNLGRTVAAITGGISLAKLAKDIFDAGLRFDQLSTKLTFATGSAAGAAQEIEYLRKFTNDLGLSFRATSDAFANFNAAAKGTAIEGETARAVFESVAKASAALKLSADDTSGVFLALGQIVSKGTVSAEELRGQLGERLPGAFQVAARALGVTTGKLGEMLQKGEVLASDFLPKFAAEMDKTFGQAAVDAADSAVSSINRLSNAWDQLLTTLSNNALVGAGAGSLADFLTRVASGFEHLSVQLGFVNQQSLSQLNERIIELQDNLATLQGRVGSPWWDQSQVKKGIEQTSSELGERIRQFNKLTEILNAPASSPSAGGAEPPKTKGKSQAQKDEEAAEKMIIDLQMQIDNFAAEPLQVKISEALSKIGAASDETKLKVVNLINQIQRLTLTDEEFARVQAADAEAVAKWTAQMEKGKSVAESLRSPVEAYRDRVAELNKLHKAGAIDGVTWARGLSEAKTTLEDATDGTERYRSAIADLGGSFSSAFEEAALGMDQARSASEALGNALEGLLKDIERIILRIAVTDPIAQGIAGIPWGSLFSGNGLNSAGFRATGAGPGASGNTVASGGGFFSWLGDLFGSIFHGGGVAGQSGGQRRRVPALAFAAAPRLHSGGTIFKPGEVPAILQTGERVLSREETAAMGRGGGGGDTIVNIIDQRRSGEIEQRESTGPNGQKQIEVLILDTVSRAMGRGQLDKPLGLNYGIKRKPSRG